MAGDEMDLGTGGVGAQGELFPDADVRQIPEDLGYRGPVVCSVVGITYRQLDYWARTELVVPSIRPATGSGSQRLYSFRDVLMLRIVKRLLDTGVSLLNVRAAIAHLVDRGVADLSQLTLFSDGASIYECRSDDEIIDLVRGGQGVFGIFVGQVCAEMEGSLLAMPAMHADGKDIVPGAVVDELAKRRVRKIS